MEREYEPGSELKGDYYAMYVYEKDLNGSYGFYSCPKCLVETRNDENEELVHNNGCELEGRGIDDKLMVYHFGRSVAYATAKWRDKRPHLGRLPYKILKKGFPKLLKEIQKELREESSGKKVS
jgi:hypothetical protein